MVIIEYSDCYNIASCFHLCTIGYEIILAFFGNGVVDKVINVNFAIMCNNNGAHGGST